jgi:hypothetical protein
LGCSGVRSSLQVVGKEALTINMPSYQLSSVQRCGIPVGTLENNILANMLDSQVKPAYTGRIRKPSFMIQLIYGKFLKSAKFGILSVPQT